MSFRIIKRRNIKKSLFSFSQETVAARREPKKLRMFSIQDILSVIFDSREALHHIFHWTKWSQCRVSHKNTFSCRNFGYPYNLTK